ncbi:circularly permuted ATP-grasp type 2 domain-containing protein [Arcobacter acticola]|uniref:Circularly permuted ATP-grasp type 2 domain-containing protein n=1 Tax=Arcobacter acticola TaxID=1849015 RepID=A0A6M8EIX0_9BACT|nr:circularly permuted type 2 ATP-grasp protein [Arcobacter acticola]QKE30052.1 circularly permuted ATP-grasp type 2 domain-containing protein [Arcobacter acticola]
MSIFNSCKIEAPFDEMFDKNCNVKPHWKEIYDNLERVGIKQLEQKQIEIDWRLEENGVTYNIYNDPEGTNRRWNLDPIPFVLENEEWEEISKGLKQRAKLLNLIFKDLYTEQKLIKEGIIPAEIIFGHKGFIPEVFNFENTDYYTMKYYAADISRGPNGKFWVISDKTQSPSGLGYAIENRLTMNSILNDLYPKVEILKIARFIEDFKIMLKNNSSKNNENPLITLLTPGPHNETYFEHSYLSSFLNLTLVQGEDLLEKNNQLWLKSLSGLKRVDAMIRRVDSAYCDPLELRSDSQLGVAGLVNVIRKNNISMINPIGVGILENIGLNPFMKNIAKFLLNEELILPQIATWWCGQKEELDFVIKNIKTLMIKKINRTDGIEIHIGNNLDEQELSDLIKRIQRNPNYYVGQEIIDFSTVPSFNKGKIEPRNAVIRAFAYLDKNEFKVMPSGLVRVSASKDSLVVSNQKGGTSKDLWILGKNEEFTGNNVFKNREVIDSRLENISTKRAENLFWLGRYLNRAITVARMIRFNLKSMLNINRYDDNTNAKKATKILNTSLTHLTMTYPGFLTENDIKPIVEIIDLIQNSNRAGTLSFSLHMLGSINTNVKNLLTMEAWRIFEKMQKEWLSYGKQQIITNREHISELDKLLIYLMAYKELIDESIFKEQGLILYDIGCKIEISQLLISKLRSLLTNKLDMLLEYDVLDSLLNSYESYNSYRAYYKSSLEISNVLEFLLFNTKYPKSLIYIIEELLSDLNDLPNNIKNSHLSSFEEPIFKCYSMLKLSNAKRLLDIKEDEFIYKELDEFLAQISDNLAQTSEELTKTYFSHNNE